MNGEQAFERQLARWLEEGPNAAPVEPVAAALAHVRTHPDQRRAPGATWRRIVSGIELTHIPSQPRRGLLAGLATVAVVIVVVAGYGLFNLGGQGGAGGNPTPTPSVTAGPTTPAAQPTPGPGIATVRQTCATTTPANRTTVDEVVQERGEILACTHTSTEPRLAGESTIVLNSDEHPDGLWLGWGTIELRTDGGTWTGNWAVTSTSSARLMEFDAVWVGSGGYEGLEVLNHVRMTSVGEITSRIFEAGPVVTGTETCATTAQGREFAIGDLTAYRGVVLRCTDTMSDPRASGQAVLGVSIDMRADESADIWGTNVLTVERGTWEGFFVGTVDPGYTTHHIRALLRGTGEYDGLFYRLEVLSPDGADAQLTGEIIQGF